MDEDIIQPSSKTKYLKFFLAAIVVITVITAIVFIVENDLIENFLTKKNTKLPMGVSEQVIVTNKTYLKAVDLNNEGKYQEAQKVLNGEIAKTPLPELKIALAVSILDEANARGTQNESAEKARKILAEVEKGGYVSSYLYDLYGYSYEISSDYNAAFKYYGTALRMNPKSPNTLFGIGHTYWLSSNKEQAWKYYDSAEKILYNNSDDATKIKVYAAQGKRFATEKPVDENKAEIYLTKALYLSKSKPFKSEMYVNLSNLSLSKGKLSDALKYANLATENDGANEDAYVAYARAAMSDEKTLKDNFQVVGGYLFKAILLNPKKSSTQYQVAQYTFLTGNAKGSLVDLSAALKLIDGDNTIAASDKNSFRSEILMREALVYTYLKDTKSATASAAQAFKNDPVKTMFTIQNTKELTYLEKALAK